MIKNYFFACILFFVLQSAYSQNEKTLRGKVMFENSLLQNVDVVNITNQKSTTTDVKGEFILAAKINDSIIFFRKEYYLKRIKLSPTDIAFKNISISMVKKPEELKEIIITQTPNIDWKLDTAWELAKRDEIAAERTENTLKIPGVYDGSINKGLNLALIGKRLFGLLKKEPTNTKLPQIEFKELARSTSYEKFYVENLKLQPHEIELFLQFCEADPKSKILSENYNELIMMDFLYDKNIEFKKLQRI
ncbi:hypothetical protein [Flavobacterium sp. GT3R68]|uniref:hypothetical protein n=1 Tax=Flavobacterium sp. GT3R68 TaxID=2594437 RepID=UPI000F87F1D2|nr:hypothetical protein [Flavobacterium sp. GT3R68]RTY86219.1 hypothetical protein EKL32_27925 [Flavobacterium sp. GSN2]TRW94048.1 hypothetical protein FNW07_03805 [Flavobacterium sp. GT3R68]